MIAEFVIWVLRIKMVLREFDFGVFTYSDFCRCLYGCLNGLNGSLCTHFMKHRLMCSAVQKT